MIIIISKLIRRKYLYKYIQDSAKVLKIRREGPGPVILRIRVIKAGNQNRPTTPKRV